MQDCFNYLKIYMNKVHIHPYILEYTFLFYRSVKRTLIFLRLH